MTLQERVKQAKAFKNRLERNDKPDTYRSRLPPYISHFLGHRKEDWTDAPRWLHAISSLLVTFAAMICHEAMFIYGPVLKNWHSPHLLPSFAAAAILVFNVTTVPLAQPRNFIVGTLVSALIGVAICKFFMVHHNQENHLWIAGALAVAVSSAVMDLTGTVHPPAGAAAILPCMDDEVRQMGWKYLAAVSFTLLLFLGIALLLDNIVTRYPAYWWKPKPKNLTSVNEGMAYSEPLKIEIFPNKIDFPPGIKFDEFELTYMKTIQEKLTRVNEDQHTLKPTDTISQLA